MTSPNSSVHVNDALGPNQIRDGEYSPRQEPQALVSPPIVGDALSAFLSSGSTVRRRDDSPSHRNESIVLKPRSTNPFAPRTTRLNSFASARPSGRYYQNPFHNISNLAPPFQDDTSCSRPASYHDQNPFHRAPGKRRYKVPANLTFDDVYVEPSSPLVYPLPSYTTREHHTGEALSNYFPHDTNPYHPQGVGDIFNTGSQLRLRTPVMHLGHRSSPATPQSLYDSAAAGLTPNLGAQGELGGGDHPFLVPPLALGTAPSQRPASQGSRQGVGADTSASMLPPASPYENKATQEKESSRSSYPPRPRFPPLRAIHVEDQLLVKSPALERTDARMTSERVDFQDTSDPARRNSSKRYSTSRPHSLHLPTSGSFVPATLPNFLTNDNDPIPQKSWWDALGSFLIIATIIIALPILYPTHCIWRKFWYREVKYGPDGSTTEVPDRFDQAVSYVSGVPRVIYHHMLFKLPSFYFFRVAQIFDDADLSLGDLKRMALESASRTRNRVTLWDTPQIDHSMRNLPPAYESLNNAWGEFINALMEEWKTLNLVSILLLSAILTILTIDAASTDPYTRYFALSSLVCALLSLLYGCLYIIHFSGSMRKAYRVAEWALEAKKSSQREYYWNVWVLLAMPAVYLVWSLLLFICCIMSFIWRIGIDDARGLVPQTSSASGPPHHLTAHTVMRGVVSGILALGCIFGVLVGTTFQRYGHRMDQAWKARIDGWIEEKAIHAAAAYEEDPYSFGPHPKSPEQSPYPQYRPSYPSLPGDTTKSLVQEHAYEQEIIVQQTPLRNGEQLPKPSSKSNSPEDEGGDEEKGGQDTLNIVATTGEAHSIQDDKFDQNLHRSRDMRLPHSSSPQSVGSLRLPSRIDPSGQESVVPVETPLTGRSTKRNSASTPSTAVSPRTEKSRPHSPSFTDKTRMTTQKLAARHSLEEANFVRANAEIGKPQTYGHRPRRRATHPPPLPSPERVASSSGSHGGYHTGTGPAGVRQDVTSPLPLVLPHSTTHLSAFAVDDDHPQGPQPFAPRPSAQPRFRTVHAISEPLQLPPPAFLSTALPRSSPPSPLLFPRAIGILPIGLFPGQEVYRKGTGNSGLTTVPGGSNPEPTMDNLLKTATTESDRAESPIRSRIDSLDEGDLSLMGLSASRPPSTNSAIAWSSHDRGRPESHSEEAHRS